MKKSQSVFSRESEWFYKRFASENQIDYLQLCILDLLRSCGGKMTLRTLYEQIPGSNVAIRQTASQLLADDLVTISPDRICLSDTAEFAVDEILDDLHLQLDTMIEQELIEEVSENLMA